MCSLLKTTAYLLMLALVPAKDIPISSNYVIQHTDSCPEVGSYFRRESSSSPGPGSLSPGPLGPGLCYICFCQNSTSVCWLWNGSRCDNQFHHRFGHALSSSGIIRLRRSLSNTLRVSNKDCELKKMQQLETNATKRLQHCSHLEKQHQCTPYESSFSDGCPPDDWCLGCTVCDCVAEGKWDCRVLSFCNKGEREVLLQSRKVPLPKVPIKRVYHPNTTTSKNLVTPEPKNVVKENTPIPQRRKMLYRNSKKLNNIKKDKFTSKRQKLNSNKQKLKQTKKKQELNKTRPKLLFKNRNTTRKSNKLHMVKKPAEIATMKRKPTTTRAPKRRSIKKKTNIASNEPQVQREIANIIIVPKNSLEKAVIGRRLIKKNMSTVQKINEKKRVEKQRNNTNSKNEKLLRKKQKYKPKEMLYDDKNSRSNEFKNYKQNNFRKKREALDIGLSILELNEVDFANDNPRDQDFSVRTRITKKVTPFDFNDLKNSTRLKNESSLMNNTSISTTEITSTTNKFMILNSTPGDLLYYKYSIDKTLVNTSLLNKSALHKNGTNETNLLLDSQLTDTSKNITEINLKNAKLYAIMMSSEFDDLKYKKWHKMKILRDNNFKTNAASKIYDIYRKVNSSNMQIRPKNMVRRKDKKQIGVSNKYNLKTIITNNFKVALSSNFTFTSTDTSHNISSLQVILQNLIKEINKNTNTPKKRRSQLNIFKYLRKIFKKIFSRKKGDLNSHKTNERMTLEILCEDIGACFMNKHNKIALRPKIHDLNAETEKIFRTITNIKGLLYPIVMPSVKENTTKKFLNDDIQKLDAILKGTYANNSLETQAGPINHVKENIHQFIKSVGRFATILNEILDTLYKNNKTYSCHRNTRLSHKKRKLNSLKKIKNLLVKYNIVQNTFMNKMYQLLTNVEKKNMTTESPKLEMSEKDFNNTQVIDIYSKSIIENLSKLKNLAQAVNYSRKKRQTMREDDAIEYLLMLMEYLLKQNHPPDTAPVNDGIDLLIEAIQNAPDSMYIKPIKKKVLADIPTTQKPTRTTEEASVDLSYFTEDINSASNRISKEEFNLNKNNKHQALKEVIDEINLPKNNIHSMKEDAIDEINLPKNFIHSVKDEAIEEINLSNNNKQSAVELVDTEEDTTQIVYYKKHNDPDNITLYDEYYLKDSTISERKNMSEKVEKEKPQATGFDKLESAIDDSNRRYEVFTSDIEDEAIIPLVINTTEKPLATSVNIVNKLDTVEETTLVSLQDYKLDDDPVVDKKPKLDWIEENFSKEIREYRNDDKFNITKTITRTTQVIVTTAKPQDRSVDNISSITVEQEEEKKKKSKMSPDEVLYRKQIEFLNSLDYGTEKTDFDDSGKDDERYSGDGFSSYFIK